MFYKIYFHNNNINEEKKDIEWTIEARDMIEAAQEAVKLERENNWTCYGARRI